MSATHRTPLYEEHRRLGARMTEFAGWEMPLSYRDIRTEHRAVRQAAGLFDLSHMARVEVAGADRAGFLDTLSTNRLDNLRPGRARYTVFCDETGGAIDDLVVFGGEKGVRHLLPVGSKGACAQKVPDPFFSVIPNASNRETVLAWMRKHADGARVEIRDRTLETGMLALQGPRAAAILEALGVTGLDGLGCFHLRDDVLTGVRVVLSRTGYTGEDGFEVIAPADKTQQIWRRLLDAGAPAGLLPVGLGARDTLRLEAGLPLYGHELTRKRNPIEAGLARFVKFEEREFIGKARLVSAFRDVSPQALRLIGLTLASRRIARTGQEILSAAKPVGEITSGTFSPTLEKPVAMGYVPVALAAVGTRLDVGVSHEHVPAVVTPLPFYARRK